MTKQEFKIGGMSCNNCVAHVEKGISELDGVKKVKVNLKKENAVVKFDESVVSDNDIINKVKEAGYTAEVI